MTTEQFKVRVGDDGRPKSTHDTFDAALAAAQTLAETGWSGNAQVRFAGRTVAQFVAGNLRWTDKDFS